MSAQRVLQECQASGVRLWADGRTIRSDRPLPSRLVPQIDENRPGLLALLSGRTGDIPPRDGLIEPQRPQEGPESPPGESLHVTTDYLALKGELEALNERWQKGWAMEQAGNFKNLPPEKVERVFLEFQSIVNRALVLYERLQAEAPDVLGDTPFLEPLEA